MAVCALPFKNDLTCMHHLLACNWVQYSVFWLLCKVYVEAGLSRARNIICIGCFALCMLRTGGLARAIL